MMLKMSIKRDAENYDEKSIFLEISENEIDDALTAAKAVLLYAEECASVYIKRVKE